MKRRHRGRRLAWKVKAWSIRYWRKRALSAISGDDGGILDGPRICHRDKTLSSFRDSATSIFDDAQ